MLLKNILITGVSGFIGRNLVPAIDGKYMLTQAYTSKPLLSAKMAIKMDITDDFANWSYALKNNRVLIHCAAEVNDVNKMQATNVFGTQNLLKALSQLASNDMFHWIQLSSCGAYGVERYKNSAIEITENTPTSPQNTYEVTKTLADELIVEFAKNHDWFKYTIIRPTIVFGEGMRSNAIQRLVKLIKLRLFFYVEDKQSVANYVHVDDVVNAINLCVMNEKAFNQTFIVSNDCQFKDFINAIAKAIHVKKPLLVLKKSTALGLVKLINFFGLKSIKEEQLNVLSRKVHFSSAKIQQAIGWKPKADVPDQLEKIINKTT